jgi:hypothetical protein
MKMEEKVIEYLESIIYNADKYKKSIESGQKINNLLDFTQVIRKIDIDLDILEEHFYFD